MSTHPLLGPRIGSDAFWASYHGEANNSLIADRLPLFATSANLRSLKAASDEDDETGFESAHEVYMALFACSMCGC